MFFRLTVSFNNKDCLRLHDEESSLFTLGVNCTSPLAFNAFQPFKVLRLMQTFHAAVTLFS